MRFAYCFLQVVRVQTEMSFDRQQAEAAWQLQDGAFTELVQVTSRIEITSIMQSVQQQSLFLWVLKSSCRNE
jgi:hypothetical protein